MTTVSGLAFIGDGKAELQEFDIAEPGPTEVRIAIKASGICGSDLHKLNTPQGLRDQQTNRFGIAGHEPSGVVESVGIGVSDFTPGDRVLAYHIMGCGNCRHCREGYPVLCTSTRRTAYGGGRDGGHAALMLAEQRSLIRIPDTLTYSDGAMIACGVGTAYSAIEKTGVGTGEALLVTGLGPVGLAVGLLAADMGITVIGSDINADRARLAREHGVTHTVDGTDLDAARDEVLALTGGEGVRGSIECSGATSARTLCIRATGTLGTVVYVGIDISLPQLSFEPCRELILKMLTLRGSWVSTEAEMDAVAQMLSRRGLHPESLVTETVDLDNAPAAYEAFAAGASGKIVVTP